MQATDLATAGYISEHFQALFAQLQALQQALPAATGATPRLLSIEDVMSECSVSRDTVQRWMKQGKPGRMGQQIYLQHYAFSPTQPRVPWPALAAFGQGLDFDLTSLDKGAADALVPPTQLRKVA